MLLRSSLGREASSCCWPPQPSWIDASAIDRWSSAGWHPTPPRRSSSGRSGVNPGVRDRLVTDTAGNPRPCSRRLAVLTTHNHGSGALRGPNATSAASRPGWSIAGIVPFELRRALLVAAVVTRGDAREIGSALAGRGLALSTLDAAEQAGFVSVSAGSGSRSPTPLFDPPCISYTSRGTTRGAPRARGRARPDGGARVVWQRQQRQRRLTRTWPRISTSWQELRGPRGTQPRPSNVSRPLAVTAAGHRELLPARRDARPRPGRRLWPLLPAATPPGRPRGAGARPRARGAPARRAPARELIHGGSNKGWERDPILRDGHENRCSAASRSRARARVSQRQPISARHPSHSRGDQQRASHLERATIPVDDQPVPIAVARRFGPSKCSLPSSCASVRTQRLERASGLPGGVCHQPVANAGVDRRCDRSMSAPRRRCKPPSSNGQLPRRRSTSGWAGQQHDDAFPAEPTSGEEHRLAGRRIEPLRISTATSNRACLRRWRASRLKRRGRGRKAGRQNGFTEGRVRRPAFRPVATGCVDNGTRGSRGPTSRRRAVRTPLERRRAQDGEPVGAAHHVIEECRFPDARSRAG